MSEITRPPGAVQRVGSGRRVRYEDDLNAEQLEVVFHPGGPMLVLAGAGTGKTRTLVYRVSRLIEDGVPPGRILLLTFTNKAAREMLDRVGRLSEQGAHRVMGGTFHSAGHRFLRRHAEALGYTTRFSILDREDSSDLMGHALADISSELPIRRSPRPRLLVNLYSYVINTGRSLEDVVTARAPQYLDQVELIAAVFRRYLERKREADLMDFDDLLVNWLLLLKNHPNIRRELMQRFDHILVDEYQDTNRLQADIIEAMTGPGKNLMVVGDDAQSIYGFRGADFDNILGFPERHPECRTFRLETNYRSRPEILALANASIAVNQRQFKKNLRAIRGPGDRPLSVAVAGPDEQAGYVADEVLRMREQGEELVDMVVLYRNHSHSLEIQVELTRRNIPFRVRSGLRFFEQKHVKDVLAHLRFIDNPRDEISFARLLRLRPGFGPRLTVKVWRHLSAGRQLQALVESPVDAFDLPARAQRSLPAVQELLGEISDAAMRSQAGEAVRRVVESFYRTWARDNLDNAAARLEDLEQLAIFADGHPDLATFLAEVTLLTDLSGEDSVAVGPDEECLTLSTAHQAKGLEWSSVFLIWVSEGRFPGPRCEDEEEERRLFYVAVTRAKNHLSLVHPIMARDRYRVDVLLDPSRFLLEIPDGMLQSITVGSAELGSGEQDTLPPGRYSLPSFLDTGDDDVN